MFLGSLGTAVKRGIRTDGLDRLVWAGVCSLRVGEEVYLVGVDAKFNGIANGHIDGQVDRDTLAGRQLDPAANALSKIGPDLLAESTLLWHCSAFGSGRTPVVRSVTVGVPLGVLAFGPVVALGVTVTHVLRGLLQATTDNDLDVTVGALPEWSAVGTLQTIF